MHSSDRIGKIVGTALPFNFFFPSMRIFSHISFAKCVYKDFLYIVNIFYFYNTKELNLTSYILLTSHTNKFVVNFQLLWPMLAIQIFFLSGLFGKRAINTFIPFFVRFEHPGTQQDGIFISIKLNYLMFFYSIFYLYILHYLYIIFQNKHFLLLTQIYYTAYMT